MKRLEALLEVDNLHSYFYKFWYDCKTGKTYTGRLEVKAASRLELGQEELEKKAKEEYPDAWNFRNFRALR